MKVLMINVVCGIRSTGRICADIASALEAQGHEVKIAYGRENVPERYQKYAVRIGTEWDVKLHVIRSRALDESGWGSKKATEKFIEWVKEYDPDVIHLHNIHGYFIHIESLFRYLKTCGKKVIWTLHDCWAFTGHAASCERANCSKWKTGCGKCPKINDYPASFIDRSARNWSMKRSLFQGVENMNVITPSEWLYRLTKESFLSEYDVTVIHNGINITDFYRIDTNLKEILNLQGKTIILGVASVWTESKGLDDLKKLAKMLPEDFRIIVVGLNKQQIKNLPYNIKGIGRTNSVRELAEIYSSADYFVNPTYEDNYPTTNLEAIACGVPVITYDTGGSGESAKLYGKVLRKGDVKGICDVVTSGYHPEFDQSIRRVISIEECVARYISIYNFR